jgi:hypothetical protein
MATKKNPAKTTSTKTAKVSKATKAEASLPSKTGSQRLSALDAAAKVLAETGQPMRCTELIAAMAAKGYWNSPGGKTPASTLYSALLRELKTKKDQARFRKTERGKFSLA